MEIRNGTTVHRIWKTLSEAQLIAVFERPHDAETFCKASVGQLPEEGVFFAVVNHYDGSMRCFHKPKSADEEA